MADQPQPESMAGARHRFNVCFSIKKVAKINEFLLWKSVVSTTPNQNSNPNKVGSKRSRDSGTPNPNNNDKKQKKDLCWGGEPGHGRPESILVNLIQIVIQYTRILIKINFLSQRVKKEKIISK